ncbi:MAG: 3-keto-5-aminohexanoate cleavage protein [Deltaproteobacteria bacterium]|nr:3-keto-5-aminohexanoate cleavage protein [Deltaproteobacteria bacterium]MBW1816625.1 3-keto-5-aminohexanoate cleavage protein [Deltaproteobacteria bacterium]
MSKLIITAAVTGSVHFPTMSEYLPITPDQIVEDAVKAHEAGAAIAHIHVRNPEDGMPTASLELFREVHTKIKERCNMILLPTTGGGMGQTAEEKLKVVQDLRPEMCSFDPAPFNLGLFQLVERYTDKFKHEWEPRMLEWCKNNIGMPMTFQDDLTYARTFLDLGIKPEFEIYELGHINYVTWLIQEGLVEKPPHLQFVFGPIVGWMTPSVKHLLLMHEEAVERLSAIGCGDFTWSVAAGGKWQIPLAATAMAMGAPNVRVGMEDSLYAGKGISAKSSADQVKMVTNIGKEMSLEPATPDEAREIMGLKGIDKVAY